MPHLARYELHAVELPFKGSFEHAASRRETSSSLFLECTLDDGTTGWGESLPRSYVTGEERDATCELLHTQILPKLLGRPFSTFRELRSFLETCDGQAPVDWVDPATPQSAAWCAVDLALLDAFGRHYGEKPLGRHPTPPDLRYSGVLSSRRGLKQGLQLLAYRLLGFPSLKLKIDEASDTSTIEKIRRFAGPDIDLRADVNMGWSLAQAHEKMPALARYGIRSFEQPLPADDLDAAAELISETGLDLMADESLNTRDSLARLIERQACTSINARISKCGGLVATLARCREAQAAGLWVQIGCQVGESSLLSSAHLHLCSAFPEVRHAEGCFGKHLLAADPAHPHLQFGRGGRPPDQPSGPGLGIDIDRNCLIRHRVNHWQRSES